VTGRTGHPGVGIPSDEEDPLLPPLVSVVVPAYDVAHYLDRCLESLLRQSLGFDRLEVVAVDDGSRDGTAELLDRFADGRPNVTVVHQANTGGPGGPRNVGLARSRAPYVFFLDADDYLGDEALERLHAAAQRNDADVVLGRIVGIGRNAPRRPFRTDVERGDLLTTRAVWSASSQKLFRRAHVLDQGLRFQEGLTLGEDQEFVVGALLTATVISVVASYPCYYLVLRSEQGNATRTHADPEVLYGMVSRVLAVLDRHAPEGPVRDEVLGRYYSVEISSRLGGPGLLSLPGELRARYVEVVRPLVERYFPDDQLTAFPALDRVRGHLLRAGALQALERLAAFEVHESRPAPLHQHGRTFARYPFLRSSEGVPDSCYDITDELALDHCRVTVVWERADLVLAWEPYAPALAAAAWSLALEPQAGGEAVVLAAAAGSRRLALPLAGPDGAAGLPDGRWSLVTVARAGGRSATAPVGSAGTVPGTVDEGVRLVGGRLVSLRRDSRGRLCLVLERGSDRVPVTARQVRWQDGRLVVEGAVGLHLAADAERVVSAELLLRQRTSGKQTAGPAHLRLDRKEAAFRGEVRADEVPDGIWDLHLRMRVGDLCLSGRVAAPSTLAPPVLGRTPLVPYATARGNLSVDVGATWRSAAPTVRLERAVWRRRGRLVVAWTEAGGPQEPLVRSLVLTEGRTGREVLIPARGDGGVVLDLPRLLAGGELTAGGWLVELRLQAATASVQAPVLAGPAAEGGPPAARRFLQGRALVSAHLRRRSGRLVLDVARVLPAAAVERRLRRSVAILVAQVRSPSRTRRDVP